MTANGAVPTSAWLPLWIAVVAFSACATTAGSHDTREDAAVAGSKIASFDLEDSDPRRAAYFSKLKAAIASKWVYPAEAASQGWDGAVQLEFSLSRDGAVEHLRVTESSGHAILDDAILQAIRAASPFPPITSISKRDRLTITGTFKYSLTQEGSTTTGRLGDNRSPQLGPERGSKLIGGRTVDYAQFQNFDVTDVTISGNKVFSEYELLQRSGLEIDKATRRPHPFKFSERRWKDIKDAVVLHYREHGYAEVLIAYPSVTRVNDRAISILMEIREGLRYSIGSIDIGGDLLEAKQSMIDRLLLRPGTLFDYRHFLKDIERLVDLYVQAGFAKVDVYPEVKFDRKSSLANITYTIRK